jgi:dTDP-4-amino-4,6-dideoxygalactose transaminase
VIRVHGEHVRDELRSFLAHAGIPTEVYYPLTLPRQPLFHAQEATARRAAHARGPNAETRALEALALPIFPELREDEIELVVSAVAEFFRHADDGRDAR